MGEEVPRNGHSRYSNQASQQGPSTMTMTSRTPSSWKLGALFLLLLIVIGNQATPLPDYTLCKSNKTFYAETQGKCMPCKSCPSKIDGLTRSQRVDECKDKNPDPIGPEVYLHCARTIDAPSRYRNGTSPLPPTTPASPPTTIAPRSSWILWISVTLSIVVLLIFLICCACCFMRWKQRQSSHSESESEASTKPLEMQKISPRIPTEDNNGGPSGEGSPLLPNRTGEEYQAAEEGNDIFTTMQEPLNPVMKGTDVRLHCKFLVTEAASPKITWLHKPTGKCFFGFVITIKSVQLFDHGEYEVSAQGIDSRTGTNFSGTQIHRLEVVGGERDSRVPIQSSDDSGSSNHDVFALTRRPTEIIDISSPQTSDNGMILPSGATTPMPNMVRSWLRGSIDVNNDVTCTMCLSNLLCEPDVLVQLAVLLDPNNTVLRSFGVSRGNMTKQEADYVEYCTRGDGNTVKGFITYITGYTGNESRMLKVYDFAKFLTINCPKFPYVPQVTGILHRVHEGCNPCLQLHRQFPDHQSRVSRDVSYNDEGPKFQYHCPKTYFHCSTTLSNLLDLADGPFRSHFQTYMDQKPNIWKGAGMELGAFTKLHLDYIEHHYLATRGNFAMSASLRMFETLVSIYPNFKVSALIDWLTHRSYTEVAYDVYKFHITKNNCGFCERRFFDLETHDKVRARWSGHDL